MELLRVEYMPPAATRQQQVERSLWAALRKIATELSLSPPTRPQLRQLQLEHGGAVAILEVPRQSARDWLRGSGCAGLFLRPFWTKDTGAAVDRKNFALHWLRGQLVSAEAIWQALRDEPHVFGLLPGGKDIAVRLTSGADSARLQQLVRFALHKTDITFRRTDPNTRWWRLGPLTAAEAAAAIRCLIENLGLHLDGDQIRFTSGNVTRTRCFAFFAASGTPTRRSLDDGSWQSSQAQLEPADPPPRRPAVPRSAAPSVHPKAPHPGPALLDQSVWPALSRQPPPATPAKATKAASPTSPPAPTVDTKPAAGRKGRRRRGSRDDVPAADHDREELRQLIKELRLELQEMRRDNERLRQELAEARRPWVHQPYTSSAAALPSTVDTFPQPSGSPQQLNTLRPSTPTGPRPMVQDLPAASSPSSPKPMDQDHSVGSPEKTASFDPKRHRPAPAEVLVPNVN